MRLWKNACLAMSLLIQAPGNMAAQEINAEIDAFNAAIASGDTEDIRVAATALGHAVIKNPTDRQAGLLAFEAAWRLVQSGDFATARSFAVFAAGQPQTAYIHSQAERDLLVAFIDWKINSNRKATRALDASLEAAKSLPPSAVTVAAFWERVASDVEDGNNLSLKKTAGWASEHFDGARDALLEYWSGAELIENAALFNQDQALDAVYGMARLVNALAVARNEIVSRGDDVPEWWEDTYYTADAWRGAMTAYFNSVNERDFDAQEIEAIARRTRLRGVPGKVVTQETDMRPFCEGELIRKPIMKYPYRALNRGMFGSVIVRIRINENGEVVEPEVLASVPQGGFDNKVIETVSKWRYAYADPSDTTCRRSRRSMVLPTIFQIGR